MCDGRQVTKQGGKKKPTDQQHKTPCNPKKRDTVVQRRKSSSPPPRWSLSQKPGRPRPPTWSSDRQESSSLLSEAGAIFVQEASRRSALGEDLLSFQTCHLAAAVTRRGDADRTLQGLSQTALLNSPCHTKARESSTWGKTALSQAWTCQRSR